jgi:hypothetical protein
MWTVEDRERYKDDIARMSAVGIQKPAPWPLLGQSQRMVGGGPMCPDHAPPVDPVKPAVDLPQMVQDRVVQRHRAVSFADSLSPCCRSNASVV